MKRPLFVLLFIYSLTVAYPGYAQNRSITGAITASSSNCSTAGSCVTLLKSANDAALALQIKGTFSATLQFEGSVDYAQQGASATWSAITGQPFIPGFGVQSATGTGGWQFSVEGLTGVRVRASAYTSGTATISLQV